MNSGRLIDNLVAYFEALAPEKWSEVAVWLPSRRAAVFLRRELQTHSHSARLMPLLLTSDDLAFGLSGFRPLPASEQLIWLYESYRTKHSKYESFEKFLKWGQMLLTDLNEADRYLAPLDSLFDFLHDLRRLEAWGIEKEDERSAMVKRYLAFWEGLHQVVEHFHERCRQNRLCPQGFAYRMAAEKMEENLEIFKKRNGIKRWLAAGLNALNPAEHKISQFLFNSKVLEWRWELPEILALEGQEAGLHVRQHLIQFGKQGLIYPEQSHSKQLWTIHELENPLAQCFAAQSLLQNWINEYGPSVLERSAWVLADEDLLLPVLNTLPPALQQANVTMGFSMLKLDAIGLIGKYLDLAVYAPQGYYPRAAIENFLRQLEGVWKGFPKAFLLPKYARIYPEMIQSLGGNWVNWLNQSGNSRDWLEAARCICAFLYEHSDSELYKAAFAEAQLRMTKLLQLNERIALINSSLSRLFLDYMQDARIDFKGEPLAGFQIMGLLESRALQFDYLIVTSVNEGVIPKGRPALSLFPQEVRNQYRLPGHHEKDSVYGYHLLRLLAGAKEAHVFYHTANSGMGKGEASRFIRQLELEWRPFYKEKIEIKRERHFLKKGLPETRMSRLPKTPAVLQRLNQLAERGFSPTFLSAYFEDVENWYYQYLIGFRSEEAQSFDDPRILGTVFHNSMQRLYEERLGQRLDVEFAEDCRQKVEKTIQKVCRDIDIEPNRLSGASRLAYDGLIHKLDLLLRQEIEELKKNEEVELLMIEQEVRAPLGRFALRGKLDRLDKQGGLVRVVDYKTGLVDAPKLKVKEMELFFDPRYKQTFQLMTYCYMAHKSLSVMPLKAAIMSTSKWKDGPVYLELNLPQGMGRTLEIDEETLTMFAYSLESKLENMMNADVPFDLNQFGSSIADETENDGHEH